MRKRTITGQFAQKPAYTIIWEDPKRFVFILLTAFSILAVLGGIFEITMDNLPQEEPKTSSPNIQVIEAQEPYKLSDSNVVQVSAVVTPVTDGCAEDIDRLTLSYRQGHNALAGKGHVIVGSVEEVALKVNPHVTGESVCDSAKWLVAIGLTESGGVNESGKYNYWGLKHWKTGAWEDFESIDNAIYMYAFRTYRPYLQHNDHSAYRGIYCQSACTTWESSVNYFLDLMN